MRLLLALMLALCGGAVAQPPQTTLPEGVEKVTSVEGITEYKLQNGLRVLWFPDPTKETVTVNITYLVGSKHENYGETGMAHLLEHLVFKGTPKHPNIPQELSSHGTRPNGTTWFDRTNYFETFSATEENLRWALDLESDRMVNSFIAKKDLDSEMTVVRNEFEMGENSPFNVLFQRVFSTAYLWHNYGKSTIGARADLENVPIDRLQAFYKRYYQPDNAILTVAGKIDEPKTLALVTEYFAKVPRPDRKLQPAYTLDPVQDGERTVTVRRIGDVQLAMAAYHVPDAAHADFAALDVLGEMMRNAPSGRLYKALVETKKAANVGANIFQLREPGLALFMAQVRKENDLQDATGTMLATLEKSAETAPTAEEVDRAKKELLKQYDLALNDSTRIGLTLSEPASAGDWRLFFLHRDRIKAVSPDDVLRIARTYLKESNRTLGQFVPTEKPDRTEIPQPTDVSSALKGYKGGEAVALGEAFDPSIANIKARLVQGQLSNGMKLLFVPKRTRGERVNAEIRLHYGDVDSLTGRSRAGSMVGSMLMRGTAKHSRQQIQEELNRLKARVNVFSAGPAGLRVNIETTRPNLAEVMKLAAEVLKEPSFPENEFDQLKRSSLAGMEQQRTEPNALANIALQKHISPYPKGHPRYVESVDESVEAIQALKLEDLKKFYADFAGVAKGELAVVGDFEPEKMQVLARDLFGDWKSPAKYDRVRAVHHSVKPVNVFIETPDKANAMMALGANLKMDDEHQDYPAIVLGMYMMGSGMNSRLFARIRQKEGLSYGVGAGFSPSAKDQTGTIGGGAIAAPQNMPKVEAALKEEFERALKDGFTAEEIAEAKKGWLQSRTVSRANDNELASLLSSLAYEDRSLDFSGDLEKKVTALTAEQIVAAMRRHIDPSQFSIVKAGDFKKAGVTQ